jgi:hypothetical protein
VTSEQRPSAAIDNAESKIQGNNDALEGEANGNTTPLSQSPSSTSGLMKQVITGRVGGLRDTISRTLSRDSRRSTPSNDDLHDNEDLENDTENDLNGIIDEDITDDIDMDNIPFL